jgi:glycosyltransferase involved in cell wall biosynthesis
MKIAQIVTYVSTDGAFGGPLTVAMGQAKELARRGHEVDLLAGWDGTAKIEIPGVNVKLFPIHRWLRSGFSGMTSSQLNREFASSLEGYDVVHVHLSRDLITIPVASKALRKNKRVILQTHGMVMPDRRLKARILDALSIRFLLRQSSSVLCLTDDEEVGIATVASGSASVQRIANGMESGTPDRSRTDALDRSTDVLFLARLHPRKHVMAFAEMALLMVASGSTAHFRIVGPDEGDLVELEKFIANHNLAKSLIYEGSLPPGAGSERLAKASVFVLPSTGEVFPMTVLESLSVGTPVILTHDCGISPELARREAAIITDGSPAALAEAVESVLSGAGVAEGLTRNGFTAIEEYFSIGAVVDVLEDLYKGK